MIVEEVDEVRSTFRHSNTPPQYAKKTNLLMFFAQFMEANLVSGGGWKDGWMGGWEDGWMGGRENGWVGGKMDGWMDGWMGGKMDEWVSGNRVRVRR